MRKANDPSFTPNWDEWAAIDRNSAQAHAVVNGEDGQKEEEEDESMTPTIAGPWMRRWDVVHHNQHTRHMDHQETSAAAATTTTTGGPALAFHKA